MIRGYIRVSTADQGDGTSPETQKRQLEGFAKMRDGRFLEYADIGVSGSIPLAQREFGAELLEDAEKGDIIVATKLDRLFRNAADALQTAEALKARGVDLVLLNMGVDPVTGAGVGKLMFTILAAVAEMERDQIKERTELGRQAKKARGGALGGNPPFGFRKLGSGKGAILEPISEEQAAIQTIHQGRDAGLSLRKISELVEMTHNLKISHVAVGRVLRASHGQAN